MLFRSLAARVAAGGYRVLIHDRRNCGAGEVAFDDAASEFAIWADDLHALLAHLDASPAIVGGFSSGCRMSLLLALKHPEDVRALLLMRITGGRFAAQRLARKYYTDYIELAEQGGMAAVRQDAHFRAVVDANQPYRGHSSSPVTMLDASAGSIADAVREATGGHGADIVYNTVGSPYFAEANRAMAIGARQIFISTFDRAVPFDIFAFYRGQHTYVGIDTLALDSLAGAHILDELAPLFDSGALKPFEVLPHAVFGLDRAVDAYRAVLAGAPDRVVLTP